MNIAHAPTCTHIVRFNQAETISTIRFGSSAKTIKNKPRVNVTKSVKELEELLEAANKQIARQAVVMDTQRRCIEQYQALLRQHRIEDTVASSMSIPVVAKSLSPSHGGSEATGPSESSAAEAQATPVYGPVGCGVETHHAHDLSQ